MRAFYIEEPELEFGGGGRHIDIRNGLAGHGPLDRGGASDPGLVRVGVVGAAPDIERFRAWVGACRSGVAAKDSRRTTLFTEFPGFGGGRTLCDFECGDRLADTLPQRELERIAGLDRESFAIAAIERFEEGAAHLTDNASASLVVCLLPETFVRRIDIPDAQESGPRSRRRGRTEGESVWHDVFKARALRLNRPVQVVRPGTYGAGAWGFRRDGRAVREMQDEATRAWNFFTGLY